MTTRDEVRAFANGLRRAATKLTIKAGRMPQPQQATLLDAAEDLRAEATAMERDGREMRLAVEALAESVADDRNPEGDEPR